MLEKNQRKVISLKTKIEILDRLKKGEGSTSLGKCFNFGESTIRAIQKKEKEIRNSIITHSNVNSKVTSYSRNSLIENTERALAYWIDDLSQKRIPINGHSIKEKALRFYSQIAENQASKSVLVPVKSFSASNGWLAGFLKRNSYHNLKITGEIASADAEAAQAYPDKLQRIIEDGGYCADQVFNADETGLFWKRMPSRTYIANSEKKAGGFKVAKDRVTLLFCCNASGDKILKPLLVNRSLRPRALKGKDLNKLPVHWRANKKAWVTTAVFTDWFQKCFIPEVKEYLKHKALDFKILLIIDNAPGHPQLSHPNVKVIFLPPNTTSLIQPLDQGIIATFKKYYVKRTFKFIFDRIEKSDLSVTEVWKNFSMFDCLNHISSALSDMRPETLNVCWKALWPECVKTKNTETQTISDDIIRIAQNIPVEGFHDFGERDIDEILEDIPIADDDIVSIILNSHQSNDNDDNEDSTEPAHPLTANTIRQGINICNELENYFLANDCDTERALKFQRELNNCIAGYRELYKTMVKSSQTKITDYISTTVTLRANIERHQSSPHQEVMPSAFGEENASDESDFTPARKRSRKISSSDSDIDTI